MQIIREPKLDFDDVLIRPKRSNAPSRKDVELEREFLTLKSQKKLKGIPIIAANMDTIGCFEVAKALASHKMYTCLHKFYDPERLIKFFNEDPAAEYSFYTMGIVEKDLEKLAKVATYAPITKICIDVANGYSVYFSDMVKEIRQVYPEAIIMAGNVCTPEMVQELLMSSEADIIKIGIGPGVVCETRKVTGVGFPQLSAVVECADAAHGLNGLVCSDGGCKDPGDIAKAFGAGADFVMLGGMLAGHEECEAEWICENELVKDNQGIPVFTGNIIKKAMKFYGMSSTEAMDKYMGGVAEYRASEGKCVSVPYKGTLKTTLQQILGGLRSACAYVGTKRLKDFSKCTTFIIKN